MFWPVNNHVQCHVYISVRICLKSFIPITLIRQKSISTVVYWQDRLAAQLDTHWPVICFPINFWSRRRVVVPKQLTDDFLIPHSFWQYSERCVSKYATSSKSTVSWSRFYKRFNKYSLQSRSTWIHVPARIVFAAMSFSIKKGLHHIIVVDILSVKLWCVNLKSSVKSEFDCRYQFQKQTNNIYIYIYMLETYLEGETLQTTCSFMDDWHRVLDASTLLRTQWSFSDNMKSDLSKTCSLTIRFTTCRAHLRDEANWWRFSRTNLILMKLSACESIASRFRKESDRWTILSWRGSRDDDQVLREQEEESRSLQKGRS